MCGLAGIANTDFTTDEARGLLQRMARSLAHRGPDGEGLLWNPSDRVGFAHRRLAVIDLSDAGSQPMTSSTGRTTIVLNGEIVNALDLSRRLEAEGVRFRGHSDTEVLLEAIEAWGLTTALERVAGMFAFAVHDRAGHALHLVRDRLGIKPLHHAWVGGEGSGTFAFASEVRAILEVPGMRREIDRDALAGYAARSCVLGNACIWRGVRKLAPGTCLTLDLTTGATRQRRYWDAAEVAMHGCAQPFVGSDAEAVEAVEAIAGRAVRENLRSDVPVACFLSGGVDSATVAMLAHAEDPTARVRAFTLGFDDPTFDERPEAHRMAARLGMPWQQSAIDETQMVSLVPQLAEIWDEPFADASQIATLHLCRTMRRHAAVALSGDGGDEVFGGYNRHALAAARVHGGLGGWTRRMLGRALMGLSPRSTERLTNAAGLLMPTVRGRRQPADALRKWALLHALADEAQAYDGLTRTDPFGENGAGWWNADVASSLPDTLRRMQFMDQTGYLVDDPLVKVDRASMSCGLEVRVPLLDHRLVEFAWRLPPSMKVRDGRGKWPLRTLLRRALPSFEQGERKAGFEVPLARWMRGALHAWAADLASQARRDSMLVDGAALHRGLDAIRAGLDQPAHGVWRGLMLLSWERRWSVRA